MKPRLLGYSEAQRILYVQATAGFIPHTLGGWEIKLVHGPPNTTSILTRTALEAKHGVTRATAGILFSSGGASYAVTVAHVLGAPWVNHTGKTVYVRAGSTWLRGVVREQSRVERYTSRDYRRDEELWGKGIVNLTGENTSDAVLVELDGKPSIGWANSRWIGMLVAGSVADNLSIVLPLRNLPFTLPGIEDRLYDPRPGDLVYKEGITTGGTCGRVEAVDAKMIVSYCCGEAVFKDAIVVRGLPGRVFSRPGDSGSIVVLGDGLC